jgi:PAS domain S-box-containing protein
MSNSYDYYKKLNFTVFFLLSLIFSLAATAATPVESKQSLSIAYSEDSLPFHYKGKNGQPSGMIIDQWRLWSKKTGIAINFISAPWDETLKMVGDGRADAHAGLFHNKERDKYLDYGSALTRTDTHIFLHKSLPPIITLDDLAAYRIGVLAKDYVEGFLKKKLPNATIIGYSTYNEIMDALNSGQLRAFAADTPTGIYHLQQYGLAGDFSFPDGNLLYANDWFVATREGNRQLIKIINKGMALIGEKERRDIKRRWATGRSEKGDNALIISVDRSYPPLTFLNAQGKPAGLLVDLWRLWSKTTGQEVRFQANSWSDTLEKVRSSESDLHSGLFKSYDRAKWLGFSRPVYKVSTSLFLPVAQQGIKSLAELDHRPVGAVVGSFQERFLRRKHPNIQIISLPSEEMVLRAALQGRVDAFLAEDPTIDSLLTSQGMQGEIIRAGGPLFRNEVLGGVLRENRALLKQINIGLEAIPKEKLLSIEKRWIPNKAQRYFENRLKNVQLNKEEQKWLKSNPVAKVGAETDWPPFDFSKDDQPQGYSIELLKLAAKRVGLDLEFIFGENWAQLMSSFKAGELDILPAVVDIKERKPFMAFTDHYITLPSVLATKDGDSSVNGLDDLKDRTLAVIDGFYYVDMIQQEYPDINLLKVPGALEGLESVLYGKADAFVGTQVVIDQTLKLNALTGVQLVRASGLDKKQPMQLHIGVNKKKSIIATILNKGLQSITPDEIATLRNRWIGGVATVDGQDGVQKLADRIHLTDLEKAWLAGHTDLRLGVDPDWLPFEFYDSQGIYKGLCADYVQLVRDRLGITMTPVKSKTWAEVIKNAESRQVDVLPCIAKTKKRENFLNYAQSHVSFPWVIITRKNTQIISGMRDLLEDKVSVVEGYYTEDKLKELYPELELYMVPNAFAGLEAVSGGQVTAYVGNLAVVSNLIEQHNFSNLKVAAPMEGGKDNLHFAVRHDWPEMVTILDKVLQSITQEEHKAIRKKWSSLAYDGINMAQVRQIALQVGLVALIIFGVILVWNRRLQREIKERKRVETENDIAHQTRIAINNLLLSGLEKPLSQVLDGALAVIQDIPWLSIDAKGGIFIVENEESEELVLQASRGLSSLVIDSCNRVPLGSCLCGTAAGQEKILLKTSDSPEHDRPLSDDHKHTHLLVPIRSGSKPLGVINLYVPNEYSPQPREEAFLTAIANTLAGVIERHRAEKALAQQLHFQQVLLDTLPNPIFVKNTDAKFIMFNRAYEEAFGIKREDYIGKTVLDMEYIPQEARDHFQKEDTQLIRDGGMVHTELNITYADSLEHTVLYWVTTFKLHSGECAGLLGILVDISQQKKLEQELAKAKESADSASRAKSDFLANMSHEIRTPMNAIIGLSSLALQTELNKKQQDYLEKISHSSHGLLGIINDILDFSKIEAGKLDMERIPFNLDDVMQRLADLVGLKAAEKNLELLFTCDKDIPSPLLGDPLRLGQVLTNLVNNAIKFTEHGEVILKASFEKQAE